MKRSSIALSLANLSARAVLALGLAAGLISQSHAEPNPPDRLSYNGYLADANGAALANAAPENYEIQFRIYNANQGGNVLWAETQTVTVDNGNFSVLLGEGSEIDGELRPSLASVFTGADVSDRYLGTTVVGLGNEIAPRLRFLTSPFTFLATNALNMVGTTGGQGITVVDGAVRTTGGNGRGNQAVDLQAGRDNDNQVAEGWRSFIGGGFGNRIAAEGPDGFWGAHGVIAGGLSNVVKGDLATIVGGTLNLAHGVTSTIAGGSNNRALGWESFIGGGKNNEANHDQTTIGGGENNVASAPEATVAGGFQNQATAQGANVGGGTLNEATATNATVAGGWTNKAQGMDSVIGGGTTNVASGGQSTVGGGTRNQAGGTNSFIGGGDSNQANGLRATVAGGAQNKATVQEAFVGGGGINTASGIRSAVVAGINNIASGQDSSIGGGIANTATGSATRVGGGNANSAQNVESFVGGGFSNLASGNYSAVGGGLNNDATGVQSFIGGGDGNVASGLNATIAGGWQNTASGIESFAAGRRAQALHDGSFVWADRSSDAYYASTGNNQFRVRANQMFFDTTRLWTGGTLELFFDEAFMGEAPLFHNQHLFNGVADIPMRAGINMRSNGDTSDLWTFSIHENGDAFYILSNNRERTFLSKNVLNWITPSDRRLKKDIQSIPNTLAKVRQIPVVYYKMIADGEEAHTHIGTIAQDVQEVFPEIVTDSGGRLGVGYSELGVLAIGAVTELADEKDAEIAELRDQNDRLNQRVDDLLERLERLESVVVNQ